MKLTNLTVKRTFILEQAKGSKCELTLGSFSLSVRVPVIPTTNIGYDRHSSLESWPRAMDTQEYIKVPLKSLSLLINMVHNFHHHATVIGQ